MKLWTILAWYLCPHVGCPLPLLHAGARAQCQQLQTVDLSQADVLKILGSAFAHCLSRNLRIIEQEAFLKCASLQKVSTLFFSPPSDCSSLPSTMTWAPCPHGVRTRGKKSTEGFHSTSLLHATSSNTQARKKVTWQGTYARPNAFDKCEQLDQPKWLRFLPADANDLWREDFLEPAPKASSAFAGMVHEHSARKLRQVKCANIE